MVYGYFIFKGRLLSKKMHAEIAERQRLVHCDFRSSGDIFQ